MKGPVKAASGEESVWVISDIHGCFHTLMKLLAKLPKGEKVVFNGDLIDRGPHSRAVVEYAINEGIPTTCGNHEHLALYHHGAVKSSIYSDRSIWLYNGGGDTLKSWGESVTLAGRLPAKVISWMKGLPYYLQFGKLLVSHTGHGLPNPARKTSDIFGHDEPEEMRLWWRDQHFPDDGRSPRLMP